MVNMSVNEGNVIYAAGTDARFVEGYKTATLLQRGVLVSHGPVDVTEVVQLSSDDVSNAQINDELNELFRNIGKLYIGKSVVVLKNNGKLHGYYYLSKNGEWKKWKSSAVLN